MRVWRFGLAALAVALLVQASACAGGNVKGVVAGGPFEVEKVTNVAYQDGPDADPVRHRLDFYYPKGQKDYPVLFFVHGGAWRIGSKDWYGGLGDLFAKNGIGVVLINYRLSPKVQHPAHVEDVARAFAWTHKNVGKYGGRADQIIVSGHSAGGHLVALLATDESYLKTYKLSAANIKAMIPMSGVYEIAPIAMFHDAFGKDESKYKKASPVHNVLANHPPALIIYADKDYFSLDSMAEQFCKKLSGCKCQAVTLKVADRDHISIVRHMTTEGDPTTQAMLRFIALHSGLKLREKDGK